MSDVKEDFVFSDVEDNEEIPKGDPETKVKVCHLTQETIGQSLSLISRTGNGLQHAFIKLDLKDNGLNDVALIKNYIHIRFLDLTNNHLTDLSPLASLTHLLSLKVDNNAVTSFIGQPFAQLIYLQWLSVSGNQLTDVDGLIGPSIEKLDLTDNRIERVNGLHGGNFSNLVSLKLSGNQLLTIDDIDLPNLKLLFLDRNKIKLLGGLERFEKLTTLHVQDNQLDTLEGLSPDMKHLQNLDVRGNAISDKNALKSLAHVSKTLIHLVLSDNPMAETTEYRLSVLTFLPQLQDLDGVPVYPEEMNEVLERSKEFEEEEEDFQ